MTELSDDAEALLAAWRRHAGAVPHGIDGLIDEERYFDGALDLAEHVFGQRALRGWAVTFRSSGGPYHAVLWIEGAAGRTVEGRGRHELSMAQSMLNAVALGLRLQG